MEHAADVSVEQACTSREDYLAKEVASLTAMNTALVAEVEKLTTAAKYQSIESLLVKALADKIPQAIEAEINKQFDDFFNAEIEKRVETALADKLENMEADCEKTVEEAVEQTLERVRIEFGHRRF